MEKDSSFLDGGNLEHQQELLQDFNLFESTFLKPYNAEADIAEDHGMNWAIDLDSNYEGNISLCDESASSGKNGTAVAAGASNCCSVENADNMLDEQEIYLEVDDNFEKNLWLEYWNVAIFEDFNMESFAEHNEAAGNDSQHANEGESGNVICTRVPQTGPCCGGKCYYALEDLIKVMEKPPKGRRKRGYMPTPQQLAAAKHLQKLRNRESAARATAKKKAHIINLQQLVLKLRAENRLRKKLLKFLEMEMSLHQPHVKGSLRRTTSAPV